MNKIAYAEVSVNELWKSLETSEAGLDSQEAKRRFLQYGPNTVTKIREISFLKIILDQFLDLLIILLIVASAISFLLGDLRNGYIILAIVFLNVIIGFVQEYKAQKIVKALGKILPNLVRVRRGGEQKQISVLELVPGDIVILSSGDKVPADLRIIESFDLSVDEKILTGESQPQTKEASSSNDGSENVLFAGTVVNSGETVGVVIETGLQYVI